MMQRTSLSLEARSVCLDIEQRMRWRLKFSLSLSRFITAGVFVYPFTCVYVYVFAPTVPLFAWVFASSNENNHTSLTARCYLLSMCFFVLRDFQYQLLEAPNQTVNMSFSSSRAKKPYLPAGQLLAQLE